MKKLYDEDDYELEHEEKAKILVTVIPFVLIILILLITLVVNSINSKKKNSQEDLQQSIMEYADNNSELELEAAVSSTPEKEEAIAGERSPEPTEKPTATPEGVKEPSPTPYQAIMETTTDYSKVEYNKDKQLAEMMSYWEEGNQKALDDLASLEHYIAMSWSLRGSEDFYYYGERNANGQPHGKGIAVYADNQYYYGEWENGLRSGSGRFMHYHLHVGNNTTDLYTYHQYTGSWKGDLPDGEGSEHYEYRTELLKDNVGYNTNLIGSYSKGLINGEFYLTNIYSDGNMKEWYAEGKDGSWVYQSENADNAGRRAVQVEDRNPDNYIWMLPRDNKNIGVSCLISSAKN